MSINNNIVVTMDSTTLTPKPCTSYADMAKKPKPIEIQPEMPAKPERLIPLKK
jgi:hypothetical protein